MKFKKLISSFSLLTIVTAPTWAQPETLGDEDKPAAAQATSGTSSSSAQASTPDNLKVFDFSSKELDDKIFLEILGAFKKGTPVCLKLSYMEIKEQGKFETFSKICLDACLRILELDPVSSSLKKRNNYETQILSEKVDNLSKANGTLVEALMIGKSTQEAIIKAFTTLKEKEKDVLRTMPQMKEIFPEVFSDRTIDTPEVFFSCGNKEIK